MYAVPPLRAPGGTTREFPCPLRVTTAVPERSAMDQSTPEDGPSGQVRVGVSDVERPNEPSRVTGNVGTTGPVALPSGSAGSVRGSYPALPAGGLGTASAEGLPGAASAGVTSTDALLLPQPMPTATRPATTPAVTARAATRRATCRRRGPGTR